MWPYIVLNFLQWNQLDALISQIYSWDEALHVLDSPSVHHVPSWSCSQAVSKPVWHIPLLCVQWRTPDDGWSNCPKHVEFHSKIKFGEISASSWFCYKKLITMHGQKLWLCRMLKQVVSSSLCDKRNNAATEQMLLLLSQNRCHRQWGTWSGKDWRILFVWEATLIFVPDKWTTQWCASASLGHPGTRCEHKVLHGT